VSASDVGRGGGGVVGVAPVTAVLGPRRLVFELAKSRVSPLPSESAAYRALVRAAMIDPQLRDRRSRKWKRWERGAAMELWQMDIVSGFPLADGTSAIALTGSMITPECVCAHS
jgi:hypothetical protein